MQDITAFAEPTYSEMKAAQLDERHERRGKTLLGQLDAALGYAVPFVIVGGVIGWLVLRIVTVLIAG